MEGRVFCKAGALGLVLMTAACAQETGSGAPSDVARVFDAQYASRVRTAPESAEESARERARYADGAGKQSLRVGQDDAHAAEREYK
jgi:hypothetical protein